MTTTPYLDRFTTNLSDLVQQNPDQYGAYGREAELGRLVRILNQQKKNSAAILGEAGVGKTALVEELVKRIATNADILKGTLRQKRIYSLELSALMENLDGGSFASNFHHLVAELKDNPDVLLFIDEMHELIGTGAEGTSGMDAANILKPAIGRGEIQVIGATTTSEFKTYIESDTAMERRFDPILLAEFTPSQTKDALRRVATIMAKQSQVQVSDEVLDQIISFSDRYITTQFFPEKAITLLDNAMAEALLAGRQSITEDDVAKSINERYHVPMPVLMEKDDDRLYQLYDRMKSQVIGQNKALHEIVDGIQVRSAGLGDMSKPQSFLLAGTPGVGKTETAKALATHYFGDERQLIRFDMSEFKYAEQSLQRFSERVADAVKNRPYSVLLLDEIEKADPIVLDLLLQVLDDGRLTNERGQTINFKDLIIILTTNIGHQLIIERSAKSLAYQNDPHNQANFVKDFKNALLGAQLREEFINRIGATIIYDPLAESDVKQIIKLKLARLNQQANRQGYDLIYDPAAVARLIPAFATGTEQNAEGEEIKTYPLVDFLLDKGFRRADGVRPLEAAIKEFVETRLAEAILSERRTGKTNGHSFIFRAWGTPPDATHPRGDWKAVVSQFDLDEAEAG